jgi:hypothetical protein
VEEVTEGSAELRETGPGTAAAMVQLWRKRLLPHVLSKGVVLEAAALLLLLLVRSPLTLRDGRRLPRGLTQPLLLTLLQAGDWSDGVVSVSAPLLALVLLLQQRTRLAVLPQALALPQLGVQQAGGGWQAVRGALARPAATAA